MANVEGFGERLAKARATAGLTQHALAAQVGCLNQDISRYERGVVVPGHGRIADLAKALGASPGWLLFGESDEAA